jgi:hypothetical protein
MNRSQFQGWAKPVSCNTCGIDLGPLPSEAPKTCLACRLSDKGQVKIICAYLRAHHEQSGPLEPRRPPVINHNVLYENAEDARETAPVAPGQRHPQTSFSAAPVLVAVVGNQVFRLAEMKPSYGPAFEFVPSSLRK